MNVDMEYRKGILFIRLNGSLTRKYINKFENEILPIILKQGMRYIVLNVESLNSIDEYGIDALMNLHELIKRNNGRASLCNLNNEVVRLKIEDSELKDRYFNTFSELSALELFKL